MTKEMKYTTGKQRTNDPLNKWYIRPLIYSSIPENKQNSKLNKSIYFPGTRQEDASLWPCSRHIKLIRAPGADPEYTGGII